MDPKNPVVKLCIQGLKSESSGDINNALHYFALAWDARETDLDACIAAHYLARNQKTSEMVLYWNQEALNYAKKVNDNRVESFFPSLYINLARSYEKIGEKDEASKYYNLAATEINDASGGTYSVMFRDSIKAGQDRTSS